MTGKGRYSLTSADLWHAVDFGMAAGSRAVSQSGSSYSELTASVTGDYITFPCWKTHLNLPSIVQLPTLAHSLSLGFAHKDLLLSHRPL